MDENKLAAGPQRVDLVLPVTGKSRPKKLKVRHLSELTKRLIVERFEALQDDDEVATAMEIPGLTGRVVNAVTRAHLLKSRKPPAREAAIHSPLVLRRAAAGF